MKITLRQLLYFDALARERHFGRAAERVSVTQPAMSAQVRELEALIGATLVDRAARGLALTPLGRAVAARARAVLEGAAEIEAIATAEDAPLRLGLIPTLAPYLVPAFLEQTALAGVAVAIAEGLTARLLEQVRAGDLDGAVIALPSGDPALSDQALFHDRFLLALPPADAQGGPIAPARPEEIDPARLLLLDEGHCLADQTLAACNLRRDHVGPAPGAKPGTTLGTTFGATSLATVSRLVASGQGITLIPEIAAPVEGRGVRLSHFTDPEPGRTIGLVTREGARGSDWVGQVSDMLRSARAGLATA